LVDWKRIRIANPHRYRKGKYATVMSILIDKNTKAIFPGFTGKNGTFHSENLLALDWGHSLPILPVVFGVIKLRHFDRLQHSDWLAGF
jgi:hypothetical protein